MMDYNEAQGADIWDKINARVRRNPYGARQLGRYAGGGSAQPLRPAIPGGQAVALGPAQAATKPADPLENERKQRWRGRDAIDATSQATPPEFERMKRGAFFAGLNGDTGAVQSFPDTSQGRALRAEYRRGMAERARREQMQRQQAARRGM